MKDEASNLDKNANSDKCAVRRSFTPEEIKQLAKDFCYKWLPEWEKYCDVCKGCNCKNNDTCIYCGCQF